MRSNQKRVLLAMGWYDYRVHVGIARFAQEHRWYLCSDVTREKVDFSYRRRHLALPRVLEDHAETARLAAEDLLSRGLTSLLYYSDSYNWSFEERGEGFVKAVTGAGRTCQWLAWHRSEAFTDGRDQWTRKRRWLTAQLKKAA